jgi:hypothetical protein
MNDTPAVIDALVETARARYPATCQAGKHRLKYATQDCYDCRLDAARAQAKGGAR